MVSQAVDELLRLQFSDANAMNGDEERIAIKQFYYKVKSRQYRLLVQNVLLIQRVVQLGRRQWTLSTLTVQQLLLDVGKWLKNLEKTNEVVFDKYLDVLYSL